MARFPRAFRRQQQIDDEQKLARILLEAGEAAQPRSGVTAGGDERRLRGVPAIGRGVAGAIRGTRPGDSLFRS